MQALKFFGIWLLSILLAAGIFILVVFIAKSINGMTFYKTLVSWFGWDSAIGKFLAKW